MVQTLDVKIDTQLEESTCFKKAVLISDTQEHAEAKIHFCILITWPVVMNGSLNCFSTDLENALEVYDEMKHMFSDDFWKVGKHKTSRCSFNFFQGTVLYTIRAPTLLHENLADFHCSSCKIHGIWQLYTNAQIWISYMTAWALNNWT